MELLCRCARSPLHKPSLVSTQKKSFFLFLDFFTLEPIKLKTEPFQFAAPLDVGTLQQCCPAFDLQVCFFLEVFTGMNFIVTVPSDCFSILITSIEKIDIPPGTLATRLFKMLRTISAKGSELENFSGSLVTSFISLLSAAVEVCEQVWWEAMMMKVKSGLSILGKKLITQIYSQGFLEAL